MEQNWKIWYLDQDFYLDDTESTVFDMPFLFPNRRLQALVLGCWTVRMVESEKKLTDYA